jgi:methylglyoxal reductase
MKLLGRSSQSVSPVILGAWSWGGWYWGGSDDEASISTLHASIDAGVTTVDTAPVYGFGRSEEVLGRGLRGVRHKVQILTKVGLRWDDETGAHFFDTKDADGTPYRLFRNLRANSIRHEVEQSLRRLGVDHIDVLQCHWPDPSTPIPETMDCLATLFREGKIGAVGVSNFSVEEMVEAQSALGEIPLASNQPKYSLLDRRVEKGILPHCMKNEVGVVVYSPMAGGILSGRVTMERTFSETDGRASDPLYHPENRARVLEALEKVRDMADAHGVTLANLSVAWVLRQPGVTGALVGARTPEQAEENARSMSIQLSDEESQIIRSIFGEVRINKRPGSDP